MKFNSGNPTLDKNLECISVHNQILAENLLNLPCLTNDIQLIETELNEPNMSYNGLPLHSQNGAEEEAKKIFSYCENAKSDIIVLYGIGLGYLFKEICDNSKNSIILHEPNLEILRVTLELVDFSKELSQDNLRVTSTLPELHDAHLKLYKYKYTSDFIYLSTYKQLYAEDISKVLEQLTTLKARFINDETSLVKMGFNLYLSFLRNFSTIIDFPPLGEIKNKYEGKTALIVSAGPTLDFNLETIKKYRENVIIFCVGPALRTLKKAGITPDFLNIEEVEDVSCQIEGLDLSEINFITAPHTNPTIQKLDAKNHFLFPAKTSRTGRYWSQFTEYDISNYEVFGSVSFQALCSAKLLGFKRLILVGQDLAYIDGKCYTQNAFSYYKTGLNPNTGKPYIVINNHSDNNNDEINKFKDNISTDEDVIINNNKTCMIKSISGELVQTMLDYALFVPIFTEFAQNNPDLELINTSMHGAQLDGFENIPLDVALKDSLPIKRVDLSTNFKFDKNKILKNLQKEEDLWNDILKKFEEAKEYLKKINKEIKYRKTLTKVVFKEFKLVSSIYYKLASFYYTSNETYRTIIYKEVNDMEKYFSINQDIGMAKIDKMYSHLYNFFEQENKIIELRNALKTQKETISESINSESKTSISVN